MRIHTRDVSVNIFIFLHTVHVRATSQSSWAPQNLTDNKSGTSDVHEVFKRREIISCLSYGSPDSDMSGIPPKRPSFSPEKMMYSTHLKIYLSSLLQRTDIIRFKNMLYLLLFFLQSARTRYWAVLFFFFCFYILINTYYSLWTPSRNEFHL